MRINLKQIATKVAMQAVGGFGAVQIAKFIPATLGGERANPFIKAGVVCILGGFLASKKGVMSEIGQGMMTIGGLMIGQAVAPNSFPRIAGVGEVGIAEDDAYVQGYLDGADDEAIASSEDEAELIGQVGDAEDFVAGDEPENEVGCVDNFTV